MPLSLTWEDEVALLTMCQHTLFDHVTEQFAHHGPRASNHFRQSVVTQLKNDESAAPVFDAKAGAKVLNTASSRSRNDSPMNPA